MSINGQSTSGKATYYGGNVNGNACGYNSLATATFPYGFMAACGGTVFDNGYGCGKCYRITCIGPYGTNPGCSCDPNTPSVIISCMDQVSYHIYILCIDRMYSVKTLLSGHSQGVCRNRSSTS